MIPGQRNVVIPGLVRMKPNAIDRVGIYLSRAGYRSALLISSEGLPETIIDRLTSAVKQHDIELCCTSIVRHASIEEATSIAESLPTADCMLGLGGGKALDTAKYIGSLTNLPTIVLPTSLSNDGFCSPQSSLTQNGKRVSVKSSMPTGVIVDTVACLNAPKILWLAGVGDLVSKLTAVRDWKLAFHHQGVYVDDFAALMSDASVFQFMGQPDYNASGIQRLATALMLNGVAMSICGSSRPASGSEHLISHALDAISQRPRLHGLQVGVATFLMSHLHGTGTEMIRTFFRRTGFWEAIHDDPFSLSEWEQAIRLAPTMKQDFFTILSMSDFTPSLISIIENDDDLSPCFIK